MPGLGVLATSLLGACLVACSGAPPEDESPDYVVDRNAGRQPSASASASEAAPAQPPTSDPTPRDTGSKEAASPADGVSPGTSDGGSSNTTPKATTVSVKIDGVTFSVQNARLWSEVRGPGLYDVFIDVTGPGAPAGSDIYIRADASGTGCDDTNGIVYRPQGDTQYRPSSTTGACGLVIKELPTAIGGRFTGTFNGLLPGINLTTPRSKKVEVTFDVLREK